MHTRRSWLVAVLTLSATAACGASPTAPGTSPTLTAPAPAVADAAYELADTRDLDEQRDRYAAQDASSPEHARLRQTLADEYARRLRASLADPERHDRAYRWLLQIASLWTPAELAAGAPALAAYADEAEAARQVFARAGLDREAVASRYFLAAAGVDTDDQLAEIDHIFAYSDALARAQFGPGAEHARPIEILTEVSAALPTPAVIDALLTRLLARHVDLLARFRGSGPTRDMLRAHGPGLFRTGREVVAALARSQRLAEAPAQLADFRGLGSDQELADQAMKALSADATAGDWIALAAMYQEEDSDANQPDVALAICLAGSQRFPDHAPTLYAAAEMAHALERPQQAIALYQRGVDIEPIREAAEALAGLYQLRVATLAFGERPQAARAQLAQLEAFHARIAELWPEAPLETDLADAHSAMGRGLVGLGELDAAKTHLKHSIELRPNAEAYSQLGLIALKRERFDDALGHFRAALELPARDLPERYQLARTLRLTGDALAGQKQLLEASKRWAESISLWMDLAEYDLPPQFQGELLVEAAKAQWSLGDREVALRAFETAVDVDANGDDTHTSVVSFLIIRGDYERALDTYHRALGNYVISDYSKVYMSLWMLAEAQRRGIPADPLAEDYLRTREGPLWHHDLARFATGRISHDALEQRAHTRGRRAELRYYAAVLGDAPASEMRQLLEGVIATDMVLFFEYDMARYWLSEGSERLSRTR